MLTEEERKEKIKMTFSEYAEENELSAFNTPGYFARRILPKDSFFLKADVISDLTESGVTDMKVKSRLLKIELLQKILWLFSS